MSKVFSLLSLALLLFCTSGCLYKMPDNNVIATLPHTNNPQFTRAKSSSVLPGMK